MILAVSGEKEGYRGSFYHLRKYIYDSEQNVLRKMNIKSSSDEISDGNEEHVIGDWREADSCYSGRELG